EDDVGAGIPGLTSPGQGIVYDEVRNAVNNRGVTDVSIMGYSQGGGSTYNLSWWLNDRRQAGEINPYNLVFTAYVDGVDDDGPHAETKLPVATQWHLNLYQDADEPVFDDILFLDGTDVAGSNESYNVEVRWSMPWITHLTIDDDLRVKDYVKLRYRQNVSR
ncbi:MAG: hypothetical protein J3T61_12050, partial [Candidatus Brocadiales bacterium]|nr:hypothetical protein [Candidatus Bathyanammoxibius sp.]